MNGCMKRRAHPPALSQLSAVVSMALALAGAGCKRDAAKRPAVPPLAPAPRLGEIIVRDLSVGENGTPAARVDVQALTAEATARLKEAGIFANVAGDAGVNGPPVARVRIDAAVEEVVVDRKAAARAGIRLRIDTRPGGVAADHWTEDVQAGAETTYDLTPDVDRKATFNKLVSRAVNDLLKSYIGRQKIRQGSADDIRSVLAVETGELRLEAIRAIADRKLDIEIPTLIKLLSDDDEAVRDAALGALVELRERRAVTELAKHRSMRDKREMRKILDAMATLGGPEAVDYLSFVADAHDDEEIRQMAKAALERLRRRADKK